MFHVFCHKVTAANDVRVTAGAVWTLASGALACSPSLNSPRSNLQTAAEFWQILPRCLLPLGDTFFIYFSSPPLWYSLHGALAPQAIVSSVLLPCLKNQMDLQGLLSTPPFSGLWTLQSPISNFFLFLHYPILPDELVNLDVMGSCCHDTGFVMSFICKYCTQVFVVSNLNMIWTSSKKWFSSSKWKLDLYLGSKHQHVIVMAHAHC